MSRAFTREDGDETVIFEEIDKDDEFEYDEDEESFDYDDDEDGYGYSEDEEAEMRFQSYRDGFIDIHGRVL